MKIRFRFILKLELITITKTFTLRLTLKERVKGTRKWPIHYSYGTKLMYLSKIWNISEETTEMSWWGSETVKFGIR